LSDLEQNNLLNNKKYYPYLEMHFVHFALKHYIYHSLHLKISNIINHACKQKSLHYHMAGF